jgi:hypothetical protein
MSRGRSSLFAPDVVQRGTNRCDQFGILDWLTQPGERARCNRPRPRFVV